MNVEQLFDVCKVPTDLKALLIRTYLNDKAKSIVSKLTPDLLAIIRVSKMLCCMNLNCLPIRIWSDLIVVAKVARRLLLLLHCLLMLRHRC